MIRSRMRKLSDGLVYIGLFERLKSTLIAESENLDCKFLGFIFDIRCWVQHNYRYWWYTGLPDFIYYPLLSMILGRKVKFHMEHSAKAVAEKAWFCTDLFVVWHHYPDQLQVHYKYDDQVDEKKNWVKFFPYGIWKDISVNMNRYGMAIWMWVLFILSFIFFFFILIALAIAFLFCYVFFLKTTHTIWAGNHYKGQEGEMDLVQYPRVMQSAKAWFKGNGSLHCWGMHFYTLQDIQFETRPFLAQLVLVNRPGWCLVAPVKPGGLVQAIECKYIYAFGKGEDVWMIQLYRIMSVRGCYLSWDIRAEMNVTCQKYTKEATNQVWTMKYQYGFANGAGAMKFCINVIPWTDQDLTPLYASNSWTNHMIGNDLMNTLKFQTWYARYEMSNVEESFYLDPMNSLYVDSVTLIFAHPPRYLYVKCDWNLVYTVRRNDDFAHRIYFEGRRCYSIQVHMEGFHEFFGKVRSGNEYKNVFAIRYFAVRKISHNLMMGACIEDYKGEWNNVTPTPLGNVVMIDSTKKDTEAVKSENELLVKYRGANLMIREYTNKFKALIQVGLTQQKTISQLIYSFKSASKTATKLFKLLKNSKSGKLGLPGETEASPAIDCWHSRLNNMFAPSGYYWVNPICGHKPVRVFCDFSNDKKPFKSYILGDIADITSKRVRTLETLKNYLTNACKMIGMEYDYLDFDDEKEVVQIFTMLKDMKFDLFSEQKVLVAYNPTCSEDNCDKNSFKSLSNPTNDVTSLLGKINAKLGGDNFASKNILDGIVYSNGQFQRVKMSNINWDVNKVLCSNNAAFTSYHDHKCDQTLGDAIPQVGVGQNILVQCKRKCKKSKVYGTNVYASESNICAAAAHAKAFFKINDVHYTKVSVMVSPGAFEGSSKYGVNSMSKIKRSPFAFVPSAINCQFYAEGISLLQKQENVRLTNKNEEDDFDKSNEDFEQSNVIKKLNYNKNEMQREIIENIKYMELNKEYLDEMELKELENYKLKLLYIKKHQEKTPNLNVIKFKQENKDEKENFDYSEYDFDVNADKYDNSKYIEENLHFKVYENLKGKKSNNSSVKHYYEYSKFSNVLNSKLRSVFAGIKSQPEINVSNKKMKYPSLKLATKFKEVFVKYLKKIGEQAKLEYQKTNQFDYQLLQAPKFAYKFTNKYDPINFETNPESLKFKDEMPDYYDPDFFTKDPFEYFKFDDPSSELDSIIKGIELKVYAYDFWLQSLVDKLKYHFVLIDKVFFREYKFIPSVVKETDENEPDLIKIALYVKEIMPLFPLRYNVKETERDKLLIQKEKMRIYETYENIIKTELDLKINFVTSEGAMSDLGPPLFKVAKEDLSSHAYGIVQTSKVKQDDDLAASFLLHTRRKLYDGTIHAAVKFKDTSQCKFHGKCPKVGLVFRWIDMFNHYGVVIYKNYLTLYLINNSEYKVLMESKYAFQPDKWYQIAVTLKTKYIKVGVAEEQVATQLQSGSFSFKDETKIKAIMATSPKELVFNTTDGTIAGGKYGYLCDNCVDSLFDALKAKPTPCSFVAEGYSETLCHTNVKRFRINWSADLERQFLFFSMPKAINKPASWVVLKNMDGFLHQMSLSKYVRTFDKFTVASWLELNTNEVKCLHCTNYCQFEFTFKITSQYCSNLSFGVKYSNLMDQISLSLQDNNELGTKFVPTLLHAGEMHELLEEPKHIKQNLLTRNEYHSIRIKIIDEKLFVSFIQNSLKDRIIIDLMKYPDYEGHKEKKKIHSIIKEMVGTLMMGNNNCQLKVKDIRMGPVDPGIQGDPVAKPKEDESGESGADSDGNDSDASDQGGEDQDFDDGINDFLTINNDSQMADKMEDKTEKKATGMLNSKMIEEMNNKIVENARKQGLTGEAIKVFRKKLIHKMIKIYKKQLVRAKKQKYEQKKKDIRMKYFNMLSTDEQADIRETLGATEGMLQWQGRAARLPVELWFITSKCLAPTHPDAVHYYCGLRTSVGGNYTQKVACETDYCEFCCTDAIPFPRRSVYKGQCMSECKFNNKSLYFKKDLSTIENCYRNIEGYVKTCENKSSCYKDLCNGCCNTYYKNHWVNEYNKCLYTCDSLA